MSWTAIETAVQNWVQTGSGLTDSQIRIAGQNRARAAGPCIVIKLTEGMQIGLDETIKTETPDTPEGAEITRTEHGLRILHVDLTAFAPLSAGNGPHILLANTRNALSLQSVRDSLGAAKIGVLSSGSVNRIDGTINAVTFEPRATMQVRCLIPSEVSETATYIETIEITNEIDDPDTVFQVPEE